MEMNLDVWISETSKYIDRIRLNFIRMEDLLYQQTKKGGEVSQSLKNQFSNQWRKLNQLLQKQIPKMKQRCFNEQQYQKISTIKISATKIDQQFIAKFGLDNYLKNKTTDLKKQWSSPIMDSGIRQKNIKEKAHFSNVILEEINENGNMGDQKIEDEGKTSASKILRETYEDDDQSKYQNFSRQQRRAKRFDQEVHLYNSYTFKLAGFFAFGLLLILTMLYILVSNDITVNTGFATFLFDL